MRNPDDPHMRHDHPRRNALPALGPMQQVDVPADGAGPALDTSRMVPYVAVLLLARFVPGFTLALPRAVGLAQ